jgi:hypothetical protein
MTDHERPIRAYGAAYARAIRFGYCRTAARALARMAKRAAIENPVPSTHEIVIRTVAKPDALVFSMGATP